ncbi:DUF4383 domain-containing protein [Saccharopolyspora rosea]|uniref:DUF4383 domain-containing protein n=1 Tax=Saccharopolyspora rosea TaxID=524884 RepID=A0ABW3G0G5_9PSEU|nr:DUF4383 domain-containing protein [Saccharopolyspora rosea]
MVERATGARTWSAVLDVEGAFLVALGLLALAGAGWHPSHDVAVLGVFHLNTAHAVLLVVVGAFALAASPFRRGMLVFATVQMVGGVLLFLYGTAESTVSPTRTALELGPAENFLHAGLAVLGFIVLCGVSAARPGRGERHRRRPPSGLRPRIGG